jgi:ubiquinone/menaquinone biosynthesis C-methylase UbiE
VSYRARFVLLAVGAVFLLFVLDTAYEGSKTLKNLDVIEAERDQWQRPSDILRALNLSHGNVVVDLGCGSGYFALKLASAVAPTGRVLAVDIRRLSLTFLWVRTLIKHQRNIETTLVKPYDPRLPPGAANAVLILNTYHELTDRPHILAQVFQSLVPNGRLVVVDPLQTEHGELASGTVEDELRRAGFNVASRDDQFINQPPHGTWWVIVAQRP